MSDSIYLRIQVRRGWLLETNGDRRIMFRMCPVHAQDDGPGVFGTELEHIARYQDLLYARTSLIILPKRNRVYYSQRNRPRGLWRTLQKVRRVGVPVYPTEIPGGLQVESQVLVVQYLYDHQKHRSYIGTHSFPARYELSTLL